MSLDDRLDLITQFMPSGAEDLEKEIKKAILTDLLEIIEQVVAFKIATIPLPEQYQEGYSDGQSQTANELRTKLKEYFGELNGKS